MSAQIVYERLRDRIEDVLPSDPAKALTTEQIAQMLDVTGIHARSNVSAACRALQRFGCAQSRAAPGMRKGNLWWGK